PAIDEDLTINDLDVVARCADHSLHIVLTRFLRFLGLAGVLEHNHVAPPNLLVGEQVAEEAVLECNPKFVHQQMVADQQSGLHRPGRNLESLHYKGGAKNSENDGDHQRLKCVAGGRFLVGYSLLLRHQAPLRNSKLEIGNSKLEKSKLETRSSFPCPPRVASSRVSIFEFPISIF